jgi:hypothetical protein
MTRLGRGARQLALVVFVTLSLVQPALAKPPALLETSLAENACRPAVAAIAAPYARRGLGVERCPAPRGFRLLLVSSDANSWVDLRYGQWSWSSEQAVVYREGAGMFAGVTGSVAWMRAAAGGWQGLILTVASRDVDYARQLAYLALRTTQAPCLLGVFASRSAAQQALASQQACAAALE